MAESKPSPGPLESLDEWRACVCLNTLVDDGDPDTDQSQIQHLVQTAEAIRADGHPRWFVLTRLIHDLGKIMCLWGELQWAVVDDTFCLAVSSRKRSCIRSFSRTTWTLVKMEVS